MGLTVPNLDDRRFQDLVDDAKRMVMNRCPQWTDHNVSDPGVTLIETFAFMTDQLLYRLNRIPDRMHTTFLDLLGLRLFPPVAARVPVTFWLSAPAEVPVSIPAKTEVATVRTETEEPVVFSLVEDLEVVPCTLKFIHVRAAEDDESTDCTPRLESGVAFDAFSEVPVEGDALLIGLSDVVPGCAVRLDFDGTIEGVGVNPRRPPLVWEAWIRGAWCECVVTLDETGGLNRAGSIILHVPHGHTASVVDGDRAAWVRGRVTEPPPGQPSYSTSPVVRGLTAGTVGVTGETINAEIVSEVVGESEGVAGQVFVLSDRPVLAGTADPLVEVSSDEGWQPWHDVKTFAASGPQDRHFVLDAHAGEIIFGPVIRQPDGSLRNFGAVPDKGAVVRIRDYATGGGATGNIGAGSIQTLRSSIPFVAGVENLQAAQGGVDGETVEQAKRRGPLMLRTRDRAVTAEDYEVFAREAAPDVSRVHCVAAGEGDVLPGGIKLLVVPAARIEHGRVDFGDLMPAAETLTRIAERLDEVRLLGARVTVQPPRYRGVTVVATLVARARVGLERVRNDATEVLYRYLCPLPGGGPDGEGWPFGRPVQSGDLYAVLQRVGGVELVEDVRLFTANPVTGERGSETTRVDVEPSSLVYSFEHQVRVAEN